MTTYNTGNPIGSTDPKDLYDNAQSLDHAVNSAETTFTDRLGQVRKTYKGIELDAAGFAADAAASAGEAAGSASSASASASAAAASAAAAEAAAEAAALNLESDPENIQMDGIRDAGALGKAARSDHVHPTDTSREPKRQMATQAEMEAGTETAVRSMSPAGVAQAIAAQAVTEFASSGENAAGTVEGKAVDPLGIREAFNATGNAPVYACRTWVNFNGTGTVAIRASGNVSSITDNGTGSYTVNFISQMPDANFSVAYSQSNTYGYVGFPTGGIYSAAQVQLTTRDGNQNLYDPDRVCVNVFR